jgi:hypothetical protein
MHIEPRQVTLPDRKTATFAASFVMEGPETRDAAVESEGVAPT